MVGREESNAKRVGVGVAITIVAAVVVGFFLKGSNEANVSGTVTLDTTPVAGAQVVFIGDEKDHQSPVVAQTNDEGKYQLIGNSGGGIPIGKYRIMVSKMTMKDGTAPAGEALEQARADDLLQNLLPKVYEENSTTPFQFDLHGGDNTINLDLKKQP